MGILDVRCKRSVTAEISQLRCQHNRKEFSAELSSIGRNHRLIELTSELLSEKSGMSHLSENVRSTTKLNQRVS